MARQLNVFLNNTLVGKLTQTDTGKIQFRYNASWLENPEGHPISISMPLRHTVFNAKDCLGFFSGLLPEADLREKIAKILGVSANNNFSLLAGIGGDCAGAVTFLPEGDFPRQTSNLEKPLTDHAMADMLRRLPQQPLLVGEDGLRLSLAGAQTKLAVRILNNQISLPLDGAPSTHILKPSNPRFKNLVQNEAFCMHLAQRVGLSVAPVEEKRVEDIDYLLIQRYDRKTSPESTTPVRLHQEDFCQALGIVSEMKYQKEGGPSLKDCFSLVRQYSSVPAVDLGRLLDAVIYNHLIGNNDAHGKNFSFLYDLEPDLASKTLRTKPPLRCRLAPLYDLVSTSIYPELSKEMAMAIGKTYHTDDISIRDFEELAAQIGLGKTGVCKRVIEFTKIVSNTIDTPEFNNPAIHSIKTHIRNRIAKIITA